MRTLFRQIPFAALAFGLTSHLIAAEPAVPTNLRFQGTDPGGIYVGVPYPDGMVPDAIMPTLPDKSSQIPAFPYDPINMPTPTWVDPDGSAQQYWVDSSASGCDDASNGGRGSPTTPRCTIPGLSAGGSKTWTLAAGDQVFIVGNGATYNSGESIDVMHLPGTESDPIWIIGVADPSTPRWTNQPKLEINRFGTGDAGSMTHTFIENIHFYSATDEFGATFGSTSATTPSRYIAIRHATCSGSGTDGGPGIESTRNRNCFIFSGSPSAPTEFVLIYDTDIFGRGRWLDDYNTSHDLHGMQINRVVHYLWFLNNRDYHTQGDSIQCSNSNQWDFNRDERPHYIYVAGSEFYENYENGYDTKGCYHVVVSENYYHGFHNSVVQPNNTVITTAQDAESYVGDAYAWFLNNRIEDVGQGIAYKGTEDDAFVYIMGNLVVNISKPDPEPPGNFSTFMPIDARCYTHDADGDGVPNDPDDVTTCGDGMYVALNTVDCNATNGSHVGVVRAPRSGSSTEPSAPPAAEQNQEITFVGNIFYNCDDQDNAIGESPHGWESTNSNFIFTYQYNVDFRNWGGIALSPNYLEDGNVLGNATNLDPRFVLPTADLSSGDYSLQSGSSASRLLPHEPSAYALFDQLYGIDIRRDINGKAWAPGAALNAGAIQ